MTGRPPARFQRPLAATAAFLAFLAYLPALTAAPGRMPADSKLYLYLDPGRFLGDAAASFDPRQFAGWVPHQHVAYLWPSGPWFWCFDALGVPDWIAHRLWLGTLMLAAGLGVRWCGRLLGLDAVAAAVAAVVYQVSLYVLPYVSRTSVMLLPWAGLGWIVALTIRATRRRTWGDPAAIALVVLTVGAVNATALAMIVPAPVLWLLHAAWMRSVPWRDAVLVALRTAILSLGVSLWWIAMLVIQGRYGADVLPYSESLADVSLTASAPEVWRGLGYWLFYVRDSSGAATTESLRYLTSTPAIVVSYLVPLAGLAGVVFVRWAHRRFAALLVAAGVVLAVGVHPADDRSPLMRLLAGSDDGGLALALRSSTRALPLVMLGLALATGALVVALAPLRLRRLDLRADHAAAAVVTLVVLANLPGLWTGAFVDPALERDEQPPDAWREAAASLDDPGARVLQVPGAEFGAYRWGYTVDQPLPGLADQPLVTRDLLPLGSPAAMDLLYALDDRLQDGTLEPPSLAPIARLLGVDTIWVTGDAAFDRFRTERPEVVERLVASAPGIGAADSYGAPVLNRAEIPTIDGRSLTDPAVGDPIEPVILHRLDDPGRIVRAADRSLLVSGSGDGLVDLAAAGMPVGDAIVRYSASLSGRDLVDAIEDADAVVVTDANRDRARHWRGSQDTTGYTEPGGPDQDVLRPVASDARLPIFDTDDPATQTVAIQRGPVTATATSYGEAFAYLPEHRPSMAVDGDPSTAWIVGEHGDPIGETLRLTFKEPVSEIMVRQPTEPGQRRITSIELRLRTADDQVEPTVRTVWPLDESSTSAPGQRIPIGERFVEADLIIDGVGGGEPFTAAAVAGVGFSEIDTGRGATIEVVRPPNDALGLTDGATPLAIALTRLRADPLDRWRADPEARLVREVDLPTARSFEVALTVRVDPRAPDESLASLFGWPAVASARLTGSLRSVGVAAIDGDPDTAWITPFDGAAGATLTISGVTEPVGAVTVEQLTGPFAAVTELSIASGSEVRSVRLDPDDAAAVPIDPPLPPGTITIGIAGVAPGSVTTDRRHGDRVQLPAAIAEISIDGLPPAPDPGTSRAELECTPLLSIGGRTVDASLTIVGADLLDGRGIVAEPCDGAVGVDRGTHLLEAVSTGLPITLDRVVLTDGIVAAGRSEGGPTAIVTDRDRFGRTIEITDCPEGCWLVLGEGFSEAWTADGTEGPLGEPVLVDGGFNGWWVDGAAGTITIDVRWTAQRPLGLALVASALVALACAGLVVLDRRRGPPAWSAAADDRASLDDLGGRSTRRRAVSIAIWWAAAAGLLVGPWWGLCGALAGLVSVTTRRRRLAELTSWASVATVGAAVAYVERRDIPFPNGDWPTTFEALHGFGMFAVAALLAGALVADDARPGVDDPEDASSRPAMPSRATAGSLPSAP